MTLPVLAPLSTSLWERHHHISLSVLALNVLINRQICALTISISWVDQILLPVPKSQPRLAAKHRVSLLLNLLTNMTWMKTVFYFILRLRARKNAGKIPTQFDRSRLSLALSALVVLRILLDVSWLIVARKMRETPSLALMWVQSVNSCRLATRSATAAASPTA